MPKAPIDDDHLTSAAKDDVRLTRQIRGVQPVSVALGVQQSPHDHLGLRVLAPDTRHDKMTLLGRQHIHHLVDHTLDSDSSTGNGPHFSPIGFAGACQFIQDLVTLHRPTRIGEFPCPRNTSLSVICNPKF